MTAASRIGEMVTEVLNGVPSFRTPLVSRCSTGWPALILGALRVSLGRSKPTLKSTSRSSPRQRMRVNSP